MGRVLARTGLLFGLCGMAFTPVAHALDEGSVPDAEQLELIAGETMLYFDLAEGRGDELRIFLDGKPLALTSMGRMKLPGDSDEQRVFRAGTQVTGLVPLRVDIRTSEVWETGDEVLIGLGPSHGLAVLHLPNWVVFTYGPDRTPASGFGARATEGRWTVCSGSVELPSPLSCLVAHFIETRNALVRVAHEPDPERPPLASVAVIPVEEGTYTFRREGDTIRGSLEPRG